MAERQVRAVEDVATTVLAMKKPARDGIGHALGPQDDPRVFRQTAAADVSVPVLSEIDDFRGTVDAVRPSQLKWHMELAIIIVDIKAPGVVESDNEQVPLDTERRWNRRLVLNFRETIISLQRMQQETMAFRAAKASRTEALL